MVLKLSLFTDNLQIRLIENENKLIAHKEAKSISADKRQYDNNGIVIDHAKNTLGLNELEQIHLQEQLNIEIIDEVIGFIDDMTDLIDHPRDSIKPHFEVFNETERMGEVRNYLVDLQKQKIDEDDVLLSYHVEGISVDQSSADNQCVIS